MDRFDHRQPKLKMLGVQCNVTYAMLRNYAKRDSRLTKYGGIVLQRFEFVNVCMGRQRLCWIKSTYPVAVLYSLLFASFAGRSNAISATYRFVGFHCFSSCKAGVTFRVVM